MPRRRLSRMTHHLLLEDPPANRPPMENPLNARFEKLLKIRAGTGAQRLDPFNSINMNVRPGVTVRFGASFSRITGIVLPRLARLGIPLWKGCTLPMLATAKETTY